MHASRWRRRDESTADIKLGLDGGQGSLKVTLSIMVKDERMKTGRQTYAEGVGAQENTSGSTNKLMVLAVMAEAPETYETVKVMMEKLQFENFPASITSERCKQASSEAGSKRSHPRLCGAP